MRIKLYIMKKTIFFLSFVILASFQLFSQVPTNGLIGNWSFYGNPSDNSGNGNDGILLGPSLTTDRYGNEKNAYCFNRNNDDYIETNIHDSILSNYTAAGWFYWNGTDNSHALGSYITNYDGWVWKIMDNKVRYRHGNTLLLSSEDIMPDTWYFVAVSYDSSVANLYINGVKDTCDTASLSFGENFYIGAIPKYTSIFNWDGIIDDVTLYDRALDSIEIIDLYNGTCENFKYDTVIYTDTVTYTDTVIYTDTVLYTDTVFVIDSLTVYDSISVTDTLIIEIIQTNLTNESILNTLLVYPNPTRDILYINTGDHYPEFNEYTIRIVSEGGILVFESKINVPLFTINIGSFGTEGLYFIQTFNDEMDIIDTKKILLQ